MEFMEAAAAASPNSLSAVLLDVAAPAPPAADGLVVPPPEFVAPAFLRADGPVQRALAPGGVLAINAVAAAPQALAELEVSEASPGAPAAIALTTVLVVMHTFPSGALWRLFVNQHHLSLWTETRSFNVQLKL